MFSLMSMSQDTVSGDWMEGPSWRAFGPGAAHVHSLCVCVYDCVYEMDLVYAGGFTASSFG